MDSVTRCSHRFELKGNGTSLLPVNGHRYAWFILSGVETNCNRIVACEATWLRVVVSGWNSNELEQACYMQMDTFTRGSHCLELRQSGGSNLLHVNGHRYVW